MTSDVIDKRYRLLIGMSPRSIRDNYHPSTANAVMIRQFLDAMKIDSVDLVGNDSGGGMALIFAGTAGTHADRLGNGRHVLRREVVALARSGHSRLATAYGTRGCPAILS
jgi:pimeloyl-ACP methyl ester carboxylesterase